MSPFFQLRRVVLAGLAGSVLGLSLPDQAVAQSLLFDLPNVNLNANQAGQSVQIYVTNNDSSPLQNITGIGFNVQIADGGPNPPISGSIDGPEISEVDVLLGTVFQDNNNGNSGNGAFTGGQLYERGTLTNSGTVQLASGANLSAKVVVDTTGFFTGTFALTVDTLNGKAKYLTTSGDVFPTINAGSITVVPEPSVTAMVAGGLVGVFGLVRRLRRAKSHSE